LREHRIAEIGASHSAIVSAIHDREPEAAAADDPRRCSSISRPRLRRRSSSKATTITAAPSSPTTIQTLELESVVAAVAATGFRFT